MQLLVITIDDCDEFLATLEGLRAHRRGGTCAAFLPRTNEHAVGIFQRAYFSECRRTAVSVLYLLKSIFDYRSACVIPHRFLRTKARAA